MRSTRKVASGRPGAAIGVDRDGVGEHRLGLDIDRRGRIGAGEQRSIEIGRDAGREGREVGAHVGQRRHLEREEFRVGVERQLDMGDMVAAMRVRHEAVRALGGPFDRPPHLAGRPGDDRFLGVVVDLRPEAAADIGGDDAQFRLRDVQHKGAHQQPDDMRVLARRIKGVLAGGAVVFADRRARLHRIGDEPIVDEVELDGLGCLGERCIDRGQIAQMPVVTEIAGRLGPPKPAARRASAPRPRRRPPARRYRRLRSARRRRAPRRGSRR